MHASWGGGGGGGGGSIHRCPSAHRERFTLNSRKIIKEALRGLHGGKDDIGAQEYTKRSYQPRISGMVRPGSGHLNFVPRQSHPRAWSPNDPNDPNNPNNSLMVQTNSNSSLRDDKLSYTLPTGSSLGFALGVGANNDRGPSRFNRAWQKR